MQSPQRDTSTRTRTLELDRNRRASHPNHHYRSSSTPRTLTSLRKIDRNKLDGVKVTPSPPDPREEERLKRSSAIFSDKLKFLASPSKTSTTTSESPSARKFLLMTTDSNRHPLPNNARARSEEIDSRSIYRRLGHEDLLAEDHRHYHLQKLQQLRQQHQQQQHDEQQSNQPKVRIIPIRIEDEEAKSRSPPQTNDNGNHTRILEIHHQQQTPSPSTFI